ncbi:MAG TPA: AmmeMemoRadiSam system protein A [Candidatus Polarisedimenticolia bacterium]|nr:AmmeMemoRadiSam system protein A [Candidatus Polarisedimenticolia bacterium]
MSRAFRCAVALVTSLSGFSIPVDRRAATPTPSSAPPKEEAAPAAPTEPEPSPSPTPAVDCEARPLDAAERETLVRLAWHTLSGHLTGNPIKDADLESYALTPCLLAPRGLFVRLKKGDQVRGLQGEIEATRPLYQQVIVFTRRAATRDPRFLPLTERDLGGLIVELSIIDDRRKVQGPGDIRLDVEGVFLEKWGRRALFLPGIAPSQKWTAETTLDQLCAQASLPKGSWSESARIEAFTTEVVSGGPLPASATPSPAPDPSAMPAGSPPPGP